MHLIKGMQCWPHAKPAAVANEAMWTSESCSEQSMKFEIPEHPTKHMHMIPGDFQIIEYCAVLLVSAR